MKIIDQNEISNPTDRKILVILEENEPLTRHELVKMTDIARSTLYDSLLRLMLKGHVIKFSERSPGPGRPKVYFLPAE